MTKKHRAYGSDIQVLELDQIPETGDELFSVGTYPIIVWNSEITTDKNRVGEDDHTPKARGAIGVLGTNTVLVDVECNEDSRGVTVKELAQFMLSILGCKTVSITPFEPILVYNSFLESEQEEAAETEKEESLEKEEVKPKTKRRGKANEKQAE